MCKVTAIDSISKHAGSQCMVQMDMETIDKKTIGSDTRSNIIHKTIDSK